MTPGLLTLLTRSAHETTQRQRKLSSACAEMASPREAIFAGAGKGNLTCPRQTNSANSFSHSHYLAWWRLRQRLQFKLIP